jgi:hypothetical protein
MEPVVAFAKLGEPRLDSLRRLTGGADLLAHLGEANLSFGDERSLRRYAFAPARGRRFCLGERVLDVFEPRPQAVELGSELAVLARRLVDGAVDFAELVLERPEPLRATLDVALGAREVLLGGDVQELAFVGKLASPLVSSSAMRARRALCSAPSFVAFASSRATSPIRRCISRF